MGKSKNQRHVLALRQLCQQGIDLIHGGDKAAGIGKLETLRGKLADLERTLSTTEARSLHPSLFVNAQSSPTSTTSWLLQEFTEHQPEAVAANSEIDASKQRNRSRSIQEQSADVHNSPNVAGILDQCGTLRFDAIALAATEEAKDRQITIFGSYVTQAYRDRMFNNMQQKGWIKDSTRFSQVFLNYLGKLDALYKPASEVPYHNASHAVDVMATTDMFMRTQYMTEKTSALDHFMALVGAAVHDVGHPGRNQLFHEKLNLELAVTYNDWSILENMHVSLAFNTMRKDPECNWHQLLDTAAQGEGGTSSNLQQYVRKGIISMVLSTDMKKHQKQLNRFRDFVAEEQQAEEADSQTVEAKQRALDGKQLLLSTVLHAADLSNPAKPLDLALKWTQRISFEFWEQGDEERLRHVPVSPMCDRVVGQATLPDGQLGFINFVLLPLYMPLAELIEEVGQFTEQLRSNAEWWSQKKLENATYDQIYGG